MYYIECVFGYLTQGGKGTQKENYDNKKKQNKNKINVSSPLAISLVTAS